MLDMEGRFKNKQRQKLHHSYEELESLPLLELGGLLLVVIFVIVKFVSLRSIWTVVTMRSLHQDLKV